MTKQDRITAKRLLLGFMAFVVFAAGCLGPSLADAKTKAKKKVQRYSPPYAAIVMDADTGQVLYQNNSATPLHPASLTKVMTLLLLFQAIDAGQVSLNDRIPISAHAASMAPSKLGLDPGSSIRVRDAIYAVVTKSANDIAVAIAEKLGGSESNFARMMNRQARAMGMTDTTFTNASGLHDPRQFSSARDMALLARAVIKSYPSYYRYYSTANFTYNGVNYHNHNRLMETYQGMDGMKTGYVGPSGFNLVASAVRGNRRLIGVVFGGKTAASRNATMASLLDNGFEKIRNSDVRIARAPAPTPVTADQFDTASVDDDEDSITQTRAPVPPRKPAILVALNSLNKTSPSGGTEQPEVKLASLGPVVDPIKFGEVVGEGDLDPAESRRIQTGLVAVSAVKDSDIQQVSFQQPRLLTNPVPQGSTEGWAIQIGAYSSRAATDQAIHNTVRKLPASLSTGRPAIAPLKVKDGWVFRARLGGYSREQAFQACKYLKECIPVAPQNN